ncbi:Kelch repeat-containing protein [Flavisolibacter tropicus]|uniref:Galactose oxidase n=1 Tax=Flavisolibacter tropicus TaxID=1492898 RepID=A0A172TWC0_9BACT|nr:kelch repeat-containing protein [Flavisolibacter tropicus]ANE51296.1 hypothetical protein SY85_13020 [Flavisolibacter tropicus]
MKYQGISYALAFFTIMIACHKDEVSTTTTNSSPPPPPPPPPVVNLDICSSSSRRAIGAQLVPVGKLSQARSGMAVVAVGNKILFAGAWETNNTHSSSRVDIYDVTSNSWSSAELSEARSHMAAVAAGNKAFFAGGMRSDMYATVDVYDAATNTWTVDSLSAPRYAIAAAAVGNKVFFAGGINSKGVSSTVVDIYDLSTRAWSVMQLSADRYNMSAIMLDNKIYFAGGSKLLYGWEDEESNSVDIYDQASNTWSRAALKRPMGSITGVAAANKIYWACGCNVEINDVQSRQSEEALLYRGSSWMSPLGQQAVIKDNKIIFFRHNTEPANEFDIYDIATKEWLIGQVPIGVLGTSIISVGNTVYLAGGKINGSLTDQVWKLEF